MTPEIEQEKIEKLKLSRQKLIDKDFKILFFIAQSEFPTNNIYEVYSHVRTLRENGYDAKLLTDNKDYTIPEFLDDDMKVLPHIASDTEKFEIGPQDFLVIPEIFTNIMEQVKKLPCDKILLFQSVDNALRGLLPGTTWLDFDIINVLTNSENMAKLCTDYFGKLDIKTYKMGIPDYFNNDLKVKEPVITYYTKNHAELNKAIKLFYLKYPHYRFLSFEDLRGGTREEFAKKLNQSFATLWIDKNASSAITPLEAMKSGSIPIGIVPEIQQDYFTEDMNFGYWSYDIITLPDMIANAVRTWLQDAVPEEIYNNMKEISSLYDEKQSKQNVLESYIYFFEKRINEIQQFVDETTINKGELTK